MCVSDTVNASLGSLRSLRLTRLAPLASLGMVTWWQIGFTVVFRIHLVYLLSLWCNFKSIGIKFGFHFRNRFVYFDQFVLHLSLISVPLESFLGVPLRSCFPLPRGSQSAPEGLSGEPFGLPLASPGALGPPLGFICPSPGPSLDPPGPSLGSLWVPLGALRKTKSEKHMLQNIRL